MQDNKLLGALEVLLEQLNAQMREVSETKRTINGLRRRMGEQPLFQDENESVDGFGVSPVRSDQFYGKPLATAVQEYLERRKQACAVDEILKSLVQGGFDFRALSWGETERQRILAISLAKNNVVFHKLPNNTFGLRSWYDDKILKRTEKGSTTAAKRNGHRSKRATKKKPARKVEQKQDSNVVALPAVTDRAKEMKTAAGGQGD